MTILTDKRRANLARLLTSFASILFATTVVSVFGDKGFQPVQFSIGFFLTTLAVGFILISEG